MRLALLVLLWLPACAVPAGPEILLVSESFELRGVEAAKLAAFEREHPNGWPSLLQVRVQSAGRDAPAMVGDYQVTGAVLRFTPRFPLAPGLRYLAVLDGRPLAVGSVERVFAVPMEEVGPPVRLVQVYPSGDLLPENVLRFYVHFSAPVARGEVYQHIVLLNDRGEKVDLPFLEIDEELWNPDGTRLTLLVDPGRIKNELRPRLEVGPVFHAGRGYTLVIDRAWQDAHGRPLAKTFRKRFQVGAADRLQPDPKRWTVKVPAAGTRTALRIEFPAALDHALLQRMLQVLTAGGEPVEGEIQITAQETRWSFRPSRPWAHERHSIQIDTALEDQVGNSIRSPFEVDMFGVATKRLATKTTSLAFTPR